MKKEPKVEYGITITKPWSKEMYDHNDAVADVVRQQVLDMWLNALSQLEESLEVDDEGYDIDFHDLDWEAATAEMRTIQTAVTCYGFGFGYTLGDVAERVQQELEDAPTYRLNEMVEELEIELEKGFIGLSK
jgi:hypothetical protein